MAVGGTADECGLGGTRKPQSKSWGEERRSAWGLLWGSRRAEPGRQRGGRAALAAQLWLQTHGQGGWSGVVQRQVLLLLEAHDVVKISRLETLMWVTVTTLKSSKMTFFCVFKGHTDSYRADSSTPPTCVLPVTIFPCWIRNTSLRCLEGDHCQTGLSYTLHPWVVALPHQEEKHISWQAALPGSTARLLGLVVKC